MDCGNTNLWKTFQKESNLPTNGVPIFQYESKWGKEKDNYYGNADSGTSSDEEHLIEEAVEEENKHLAKLRADDFEAFDNPELQKIGRVIEKPQIDISVLEEQVNEEEKEKLKQTIRDTIEQLVDVTQMLQDPEIPDYEKNLLNSVLTNASFYLYMVSNGYRSPFHGSLEHNAEIFRLITGKGEGEEEEEETVEKAPEQEEEEEHVEAVPEKHIPDHLKKIGEGEYRQASRVILKNKAVVAHTPKFRHNPRAARSKKYAHALHKYNLTHKRKSMPSDGIYKGERAGISKDTIRSTKLTPAH